MMPNKPLWLLNVHPEDLWGLDSDSVGLDPTDPDLLEDLQADSLVVSNSHSFSRINQTLLVFHIYRNFILPSAVFFQQ